MWHYENIKSVNYQSKMDYLDFQTFSVVDNSINKNDLLPEPMKGLNLSTISGTNNKGFENNDEEFQLPELLNKNDTNSNENKSVKNLPSRLSERMASYVKFSVNQLGTNNGKKVNNDIPNDTASNITSKKVSNGNFSSPESFGKLNTELNENQSESTNLLLSKKLSDILHDYSLTNYQSTMKVRKSLNILEYSNNSNSNIENQISDINNLGSLKDLIKDSKDSNINELNLNIDKLTSADYIGTLTRKALRNNIETELLREHISVLEEFRPIVRRIKRLSSSIEQINQTSEKLVNNNQISRNLDTDGQESIDDLSIIDKVDKLRSEMEKLKLKKKMLNIVKENFTLTQVEDDILANGSINKEFFQVVDKVNKIMEKSSYLLALPDPQIGNALVENMNSKLELVTRRTFSYLLDYLYSYDPNKNTSDISISQDCLIYLSNDVTHFNEFTKRITTERSKLILDEFLSQFDLNSKDTKSIVLNAHDPVRYIGDVLASVHTLIANEADFISLLFNFDQDKQQEINQLNNELLNNVENNILNTIVQSLANSCKIRVEQIVRFEDSVTVNFEITQLLKLYKLMFIKKNINETNALITNLDLLIDVANDKIIESFTKFVENQSEIEFKNNDTDLLPPDWVSTYLNKLTKFLELYEKNNSNVDHTEDPKDIISEEFLIKTIEEPFDNILIKQIENLFPLAKKNEEVKLSFLTVQLNCFDLIKTRLAIFSINIFLKRIKGRQILESIDNRLNSCRDKMQELQIKALFENTGLGLYSNLFNMIFPIDHVKDELDYDMYFPLNDNDLMKLSVINTNVHEKLNEYLPQALTNVQENLLFKLTSPTIADEISEVCFKKLSQFYSIFRKVLVHINPDSEDDVYQILNFTEQEFDILIGIEDYSIDDEKEIV